VRDVSMNGCREIKESRRFVLPAKVLIGINLVGKRIIIIVIKT
jgi:hypothetical protein